MKSLLKIAALAASVAMAPVAHAQVANPNVGVLDVDRAIAESAAYKAASNQIQTAYKTQITAYQTRETAIRAELSKSQADIQALQKNPATPKATLDARIAAFQTRARALQEELQRLSLPFARPDAYAQEQINNKLDQAVQAAMTAKKVGILLKPEAVMGFAGGLNLTADVTTQLNALVPSVGITPPANWQPGQNEQAAAPAAAAQPGAPGR